MPDHDTTHDAPPPTGPFFSTWGPLDGPILGRDEAPALGVLDARAHAMPNGTAYPVGLVEHRRGPATTFRLVVNKMELPGRWLCVGGPRVALEQKTGIRQLRETLAPSPGIIAA